MKLVDLDYVVARYLQSKGSLVGEQDMMQGIRKFVELLWGAGFEVGVSFQENARGRIVSPEVVSSLKRLRTAGLVKFDHTLALFINESSKWRFQFKEITKANDPRLRVFASHREHVGIINDSKIFHLLESV